MYCSKKCYRATYFSNPDLRPSESLAYLLGVLVGDGHANDKQFIVQVTSREFADRCCAALVAINTSPKIKRVAPQNVRCREQWRVVASSVPLGKWMMKMTIPSIKRFISKPNHRRAFICGFYESEGHAGLSLRKIRAPHASPDMPSYNRTYASGRLNMTNTHKPTLALIGKWANQRGHSFRLRLSRRQMGNCKAAFELLMTTRADIERFLADIRPVTKLLPADSHPSRRKLLSINGIRRSVPDWARRLGMPPARLASRLKRGWHLDRAMVP